MRFGIMQGRLSSPIENKIQDFPINTWRDEFENLKYLPVMPYYSPDVDTIEWIVPFSNFKKNPIFTEIISRHQVHSICADSIVHENFPDLKFLDEYFLPICIRSSLLGINRVTVPVLENSSIINKDIRKKFITYILEKIIPVTPNISLSFEFESPEEVIDEVLESHPSFKLTYDTGNFTNYFKNKVDHKNLLTKYKNRIDNIHLKDRTVDSGLTVEPGEGDTNFIEIFEVLHDIDYSGQFTLQTARGCPGRELITISRHLDYFNNIMELINV